MESLTLSLLQNFFISPLWPLTMRITIPHLSEVDFAQEWICPNEWAPESCSRSFHGSRSLMPRSEAPKAVSHQVHSRMNGGLWPKHTCNTPLYLVILVERAWICWEVWLMPTQLYFSFFFSLNNCKLFITNSSCSIFAWNHKNKQHKVSPRHVSHYKVILELYKGCEICRAAPCSWRGNRLY